MEHFDRNLQYKILVILSDFYPHSIDLSAFEQLKKLAQTEKKLAINLCYLEEHGLICSGLLPTSDCSFLFDYKGVKIASRGLDLLANDGNLSAITNPEKNT